VVTCEENYRSASKLFSHLKSHFSENLQIKCHLEKCDKFCTAKSKFSSTYQEITGTAWSELLLSELFVICMNKTSVVSQDPTIWNWVMSEIWSLMTIKMMITHLKSQIIITLRNV